MPEHTSQGDPSGRRLAMRRAGLLSEAARLARVLEILLARATYSNDMMTQLIKELTEQEQVELQRAYGRIEPRRRFKGQTPAPLLDQRLINCLFIDESGRSFPEPKQPGGDYFALAAVALREEECQKYCDAADEIKMNFFGRKDFTFHEPYMRNRYQDDQSRIDYSFSLNSDRWEEFDASIAGLISKTPFTAFGVGVRKQAFQDEFVATGIDPYLPTDVYALAILFLLERYVDMLSSQADRQIGKITLESQGPKEDAYHQLEYARVLLDGSQWVPDAAFRNWLQTGLLFEPKKGSSPMELADFLSRDLFEWIRTDCSNQPKWWGLYSEKIYLRGDGMMGKFGIKVFPDSDSLIRERVLAHRDWCKGKIESAPTQGAEAPIA